MAKSEQPIFQLNKKEKVASSKIDVIKELIFGDQIEVYDLEFETLRKEIVDKKDALDLLIKNIKKELDASIDEMSKNIELRIDGLESKIESKIESKLESKIESFETDVVTKEDFGKILVDLGKKISKK